MIETSFDSLDELWEALNVPRGSVVLCHSYLPSLGKLVPNHSIIVDTLMERLGPKGTLVVPTFTYSYFNNQVYDVENSPSTVGALGDIVRNSPGAVRSLDPNFSMAATGFDAENLMRRENPQSLGPGSIYDKLMEADVQCLLLGVDFTALPIFMHLEKIHKVTYRYDKDFVGETLYRGRRFEDRTVHFVRDEKLNPISDRMKVGSKIDESERCNKVLYGYGWHRLVSGRVVSDVVATCLAEDPFCLIKTPVGSH